MHAGRAGHGERKLAFGVIAVLPKQGVEFFVQRFAFGFASGGELGQEHRGDGGVFIADVRADQVAVRFFAAEDEVFRAGIVDFLADPFEADLQIAVRLDAELIGNAADHFGGDERFADEDVSAVSVPAFLRAERT